MDRRGQNISEYALVAVVIIAAVSIMSTYCKRGVQGIVKATSDKLGECAVAEYASITGKTIDAQVLGASQMGIVSGSSSTEPAQQSITTVDSVTNGARSRDIQSYYASSSTNDATYLEKNRNAFSLLQTTAGTVDSGVTASPQAGKPLSSVSLKEVTK